ncbi:MAG: hypothetical protein ABMA64_41075 [Myxococcota bacterium]
MVLLGWLAGCGGSVDCSREGATLVAATEGAPALTCAEAGVVIDYLELLAGRPVPRGDQQLALGAIAHKYSADPAQTRGWIERARAGGTEIASAVGSRGAELRIARVWAADKGQDLITAADDDLWNVQQRTLSVWTHDDDEKTAMTESDLEAWIRYASLCREVQGGGVLRISVADRVTVYKALIERFDTGDRSTQVALASLGPIWTQVADAWQAANFEQQQGWIRAAPLPPPMTATSLAYAEAVFDSDVVLHVATLQQQLGPFPQGQASLFAGAAGASP